MFLSELKPTLKELFLDVAIYLSMSDGDFSSTEEKMLMDMCNEMGIEKRKIATMEYRDALKKISEDVTEREKRIILLEIAGIVLADGNYSEEEMNVVKEIGESLTIDYAKFKEVIVIVKELLDTYTKIGAYLSSK